MKKFRPRLTDLEIKFLIESLKHTPTLLDVKEKEFKNLEARVWRLRKEMRYNTMVWKELKEAKEQLEQVKGLPMQLIYYRGVCNSLIRRFEGLLEGKRLHSFGWTESYIEKILEPKSL